MNLKSSVLAFAAAAVVLSSCSTMGSISSMDANKANVASRVYSATVVSASNTNINTTDTAKNLGTGLGAVLGAGSGALLGRGKGNLVSAVGFGAAGALAGRYLTDSMGNTKGQTLTLRVDGSKECYSVTQPVYKQFGYIPVGTHGTFHMGGESKFVPDGY